MESNRRSFFALLGCGAAAAKAAIPEPESIHALIPGETYAICMPENAPFQLYEHMDEFLKHRCPEFQFLLFPHGTEISKLDRPKEENERAKR